MTVLREQRCLQTLGSLINQSLQFPPRVTRFTTRTLSPDINGASCINTVQKYHRCHSDGVYSESEKKGIGSVPPKLNDSESERSVLRRKYAKHQWEIRAAPVASPT